jgi:hypothetical protein
VTTTSAYPCEHGDPGGCSACALCRHNGCALCGHGQATSEEPDRLYTLRLPAALHEALKVRAKADDRRLAQTFRAALRLYLHS